MGKSWSFRNGLDNFEYGNQQSLNHLTNSESKNLEALKIQRRGEPTMNSFRNDLEITKIRQDQPKMHLSENEIFQNKGSNVNQSMINDSNTKRNQSNTIRQVVTTGNKELSSKIQRSSNIKGSEYLSELEESKNFPKGYPTPSGSLIHDDIQSKQTPTDSQRESKPLPFVMNPHPRVLETQKKEAEKHTPITNQRFNDINLKLQKEKDVDSENK